MKKSGRVKSWENTKSKQPLFFTSREKEHLSCIDDGKKIWLLISTLATWGKLIPVSLKRALDVFRCLPRLVHQILRCNLAFRGGCFVSATRVRGRGCNIFTVIANSAWQQQVNHNKRVIYFLLQICITVNLIINSLSCPKKKFQQD